MAEFNESALKAHLKTKEYKNAYLFIGKDAYLKNYYVNLIKSRLVDPAFEDFNLHIYDDNNVQLDDALKDAQIFPMMSEYSVIILKDYPITRSQKDLALLLEYLEDVNEAAVFIMVYDSVELNEKTSTFKKLTAAFDKAGAVVRLDKRSLNDMVKMIEKGARSRGSSISYDTARYMIEICGDDMQILVNELDKLSAYAKGGEITKAVVDEMAVKSLQARAFDINKALLSGRLEKALEIVNTLFEMQEEPVSMVSAISSQFVDLYRAKCAKTAGLNFSEVGKDFDYKRREFVLSNASAECARFKESQLRQAIDICLDTDYKLKSSSADGRMLIEELLIKLLVILRGGGNA